MTDEITLDAPETRIERFLAAAAGMDGITLDEPVTRIEKYLYKIAQSSGGVPAVEDADKGKYLHANESTGALEWAEGGTGGGLLVVTSDENGTLDKTWQEIFDAASNGVPAVLRVTGEGDIWFTLLSSVFVEGDNSFFVDFGIEGVNFTEFFADTASGYPSTQS